MINKSLHWAITILLIVISFQVYDGYVADKPEANEQQAADGDVCISGLIRTEYDVEAFGVIVCGELKWKDFGTTLNEDTHLAAP